MNIKLFRNFISNSQKFQLLFFSSSSSKPKKSKSIPISEYLINRHGFSPETTSKISARINTVRNPEKSDSVLDFLHNNGFSNTHLEKLLKILPRILNSNLEKTIKPKLNVFMDLGFTKEGIADIISSNPWLLKRSANNRLVPSIVSLKEIVGSTSGISKVLKGSTFFLHHDLEKTCIPNIELLKSCGICISQIIKVLYNYPRFLLIKPETMKELIQRADELGGDRESKMYIHGIRALGSMTKESWELKLELFKSLGWSEDDILFMFKRMPSVFTASNRKLKEGVEFLFKAAKCNASFLVLHPEMLMYSLERRVKPRVEVLETLKSKNLIAETGCWASICKMTDDRFAKKYILPHENEVGSISIRKH